MSETMMMDAVADIHDRYVLEFADVQPVAKVGLMRWMLPAAACLCLVLGALALRFVDGPKEPPALELPPVAGSTQSQISATPPAPPGATVWGSLGHFGPADFETVDNGTIWLCECLTNAMKNSKDDTDIFAVLVAGFTETSPLKDTQVYQEFVLPLGAPEDFMENYTIFLTKKQIETLECPENMGIAMHLCTLPDVKLASDGKVLVSEAYFKQLNDETMTVFIEFDDSYEVCCEREDRPDCGFKENLRAFLRDYALSEEACEYWLHYPSHIVILKEVEKDTVYRMLEDCRIDYIDHIRGEKGNHFGPG